MAKKENLDAKEIKHSKETKNTGKPGFKRQVHEAV